MDLRGPLDVGVDGAFYVIQLNLARVTWIILGIPHHLPTVAFVGYIGGLRRTFRLFLSFSGFIPVLYLESIVSYHTLDMFTVGLYMHL